MTSRIDFAIGIDKIKEDFTDTGDIFQGGKVDVLSDIPKAPLAEVPESELSHLQDLIDFVEAKRDEINDAYDFTTIYIDTDEEKALFGVEQDSVALISTDWRKTLVTLKSDPLVVEFDNSKTLKRVKDWQKYNVEIVGLPKTIWATLYTHKNNIPPVE